VRLILLNTFFVLAISLYMASAVAQVDVPPGKGGSDVQSLISDGRRLLQEKKYQEALKRFESTLARDEKNAEALYYAGTIYMILGRTQKGLAYIERSVALAPNNLRLRFILAKTYETLSMIDEAIDAFRKVQTMAPGSPLCRSRRETVPSTETRTRPSG